MSLALIAGQGGLPPVLVRTLTGQGHPPLICELEQFPSEIDPDLPRRRFRLETLGSLLEDLKAAGVTQICMAGAVRRPGIDPARIDAATAPLVPRIAAAIGQGDDGALRAIITLFEDHGFKVVGAATLVPDLVPAHGMHCGRRPDGIDVDIAAAQEALAEMGRADLGQAVIVRDGQVIAREEDAGTDALLAGLADAARGGLLYKAPKPGQDLRADMPLIGPHTAQAAAQAGLSGIVIGAGGVMVLDLPIVVTKLEARDMFLWVKP
ncbi:LpxI family protein [Loktanella sp. IMCC34160]|uniref:LpxI family protein n=1 Tax=Loktanella sp. IMCC34160 TaxID=2510646 RepID=UPI00101B8C61|nr:UDP-2,3-diacylglucosamine diphosphatase LpxI [Loktanella sp. IMCC34160]RYG92176.1 LpxI family protein [Loktanella sp. IMCC34160]